MGMNDVGCMINAIRSETGWNMSVSGYAFKYGGYTNSFNVLTRCDSKLWSQAARPLVSGKTYRVQVERVGSRLRMLVDNCEIFSVVDHGPAGPVPRVCGRNARVDRGPQDLSRTPLVLRTQSPRA